MWSISPKLLHAEDSPSGFLLERLEGGFAGEWRNSLSKGRFVIHFPYRRAFAMIKNMPP